MRSTVTSLGLGLLLMACGGAKPAAEAAPEQPSAAAGGETVSETAEEPMTEALGAAVEPTTGPAKVTVTAKVGRDPAAAKVRVLAEDGSVLAEGKSGVPLDVQSGELTLEATITDPKAIIDLPTQTSQVTVAMGDEAKETISFARSLVKVTVTIRGKADPTAVVTLSRDGQAVAKLTSGAADYVSISPGRYDASVKSQRAEITVNQLILNEGATHNIPLNVN
jgi:hypothetical protein